MEQLVRENAGEMPCYGLSTWSGPIAIGEWDVGNRPPTTVGLAFGSMGSVPFLRTWPSCADPRRARGELALQGSRQI